MAGCTSTIEHAAEPTTAPATQVAMTGTGGDVMIADFRADATRADVRRVRADCGTLPDVARLLPPDWDTGPEHIKTLSFELRVNVARDHGAHRALHACLLAHRTVTQALIPM